MPNTNSISRSESGSRSASESGSRSASESGSRSASEKSEARLERVKCFRGIPKAHLRENWQRRK